MTNMMRIMRITKRIENMNMIRIWKQIKTMMEVYGCYEHETTTLITNNEHV